MPYAFRLVYESLVLWYGWTLEYATICVYLNLQRYFSIVQCFCQRKYLLTIFFWILTKDIFLMDEFRPRFYIKLGPVVYFFPNNCYFRCFFSISSLDYAVWKRQKPQNLNKRDLKCTCHLQVTCREKMLVFTSKTTNTAILYWLPRLDEEMWKITLPKLSIIYCNKIQCNLLQLT